MTGFFHELFSENFMPHGHCYLWRPGVLALHIISDALIALAYFSIPFTLVHFIRKRRDLPFNWMFLCFAVFIISCGLTHLMEIYVIWHPVYWLQGGVKALTAAVSVPTAFFLVRLMPQALALPSPTALRREIAEREKTETVLRESEERFRRSFEDAPIGMALTDLAGRWLRVNHSLCEMVGYSEAELLATDFQSITHPDDLPASLVIRNQLLTGSLHDCRMEKRYRHKEGHIVYVLLNVSAVRDASGNALYFVSQIQDISERRKLEAQILQSQKMEAIGRLAGGIAHDFNNILGVIQLQASLLQADENLPRQQMDMATEIGKASERASNLTRQLLMFSRQQAMQPADLNLNEVVTNVAKMLQRVVRENIQLQFNLSPQPVWIHGDAGMLDQIILNLAVNGRDAMPDGGRLAIEVSVVEFDAMAARQTANARPGLFACLSVTDNGTGIPPEIISRIFEPFFTTKEIGKGTGLGLATVFGIVQQHQGWVNVYSETGRGTAFRVYLPRLAGLTEAPRPAQSLAAVRGGSETILLVEDDETLRTTVQSALSLLGYRVLEAANGADALELWRQHRSEIRLLLTDLVMPGGMTGRELAEQILAQEPKLKVIFSSGYSAEAVSQGPPLEEGVNYLPKPFPAHKLGQVVRDILDRT